MKIGVRPFGMATHLEPSVCNSDNVICASRLPDNLPHVPEGYGIVALVVCMHSRDAVIVNNEVVYRVIKAMKTTTPNITITLHRVKGE